MLVASELLPTYLTTPEWQKHHTALIALAQIAEGCSKVMIKKSRTGNINGLELISIWV